MKVTTSKLIRWAGLSAMAAGIIFAGIQPTPSTRQHQRIHHHYLLQNRHVHLWPARYYRALRKASGRNRLVGFGRLSSANHLLCSPNVLFIRRTTILPLLTTVAPTFVESVLGLSSGAGGPMNLGAFTTVYSLLSLLYLFGSSPIWHRNVPRRILPRWAAALLAISGPLAGTMFTLLPHQLNRLTSIPMGIAMVWLGYALFSERESKSSMNPCLIRELPSQNRVRSLEIVWSGQAVI